MNIVKLKVVARRWWKTLNPLRMFRLSDIGKFFPGCARLDFEQILDSVAFRFVESLKTIIQTRECLPWCHCRSSNDKCKIACKWQGAQLISADLSWSQILHFSTLCGTKTKLSTDGILGLQVESKECCDVKQKWFGKKHLAIKWKWSHYRTRIREWSRHGRVLEFQTVKTEYRWRIWYYTRLSYWFAIFSYTPYFLADCSRQAQLGRLWSLILTNWLKFREATAKSQRDDCNDLLNRVP